MSVDVARLPSRLLFDTTVFVKAWTRADPLHASCRALYDAMRIPPRTVLIAAPSLAELMRKREKNPFPRTTAIQVLPFGQKAAMLLGRKFPPETLKQWRAAGGAPVDFYKFDSMILAVAMCHGVPLVTTDEDQATRGRALGIKVHHPDDFKTAQTSIKYR